MDENLNKPAFSAARKELIAALLSYLAAYIYVAAPFAGELELWLLVFTAIYFALVEYLCASRRRFR